MTNRQYWTSVVIVVILVGMAVVGLLNVLFPPTPPAPAMATAPATASNVPNAPTANIITIEEPTATPVPTCKTREVAEGDMITTLDWGFFVGKLPTNETIQSGKVIKTQLVPGTYTFNIPGTVTFCNDQMMALKKLVEAEGETSVLLNLLDLGYVEVK